MPPVAESWTQMAQARKRVLTEVREVVDAYERRLLEREKYFLSPLAIQQARTPPPALPTSTLGGDSSLDRIHFYLPYHGLNDRYAQELITRAYELNIRGLGLGLSTGRGRGRDKDRQNGHGSPDNGLKASLEQEWEEETGKDPLNLNVNEPLNGSNKGGKRKTRVGFLSKFLGLFEPHGLLLDGIMRHLPRDEFEVWALAVARTDGKPLAWGVRV